MLHSPCHLAHLRVVSAFSSTASLFAQIPSIVLWPPSPNVISASASRARSTSSIRSPCRSVKHHFKSCSRVLLSHIFERILCTKQFLEKRHGSYVVSTNLSVYLPCIQHTRIRLLYPSYNFILSVEQPIVSDYPTPNEDKAPIKTKTTTFKEHP